MSTSYFTGGPVALAVADEFEIDVLVLPSADLRAWPMMKAAAIVAVAPTNPAPQPCPDEGAPEDFFTARPSI